MQRLFVNIIIKIVQLQNNVNLKIPPLLNFAIIHHICHKMFFKYDRL